MRGHVIPLWAVLSLLLPITGYSQSQEQQKPAPSIQQQEVQKQIRDVQKVRKAMADLYETLSKLDDKQWGEMFGTMAKIADEDGMKENAAVYRELAKLENRSVTQDAIKRRLDNVSENGIGAVIWWWIHKWTRGAVISPFTDLSPLGTFLAIVLTLDAEKGENF